MAAYGDNYERLQQVKAKYDPGNLFRVNRNIPPAI
jgi:FAD/FMN-containing dehydrogenase